jgi:hypothetical protein
MLKRMLLLFCISGGFGPLLAQNYVQKPSFELPPNVCTQLNGAPFSPDILYQLIPPWKGYRMSVDLLDRCWTSPASLLHIFDNRNGHQIPYDGDRMIGFTYDVDNLQNDHYLDEFIGAELATPLSIGATYHVEMHFSRADTAIYASNNLGLLFLNSGFDAHTNPMPFPNRCDVCSDSVIRDALGWTTVEGDFTADSAYTHFVIGHLKDPTAYETTTGIYLPSCYYFLDYVCVVPLGGLCDVPLSVGVVGAQPSGSGGFTVYPNPVVKGYASILYRTEHKPVDVFDLMGRPVGHYVQGEEIDTAEWPQGTYFIKDLEGHSAKVVVVE